MILGVSLYVMTFPLSMFAEDTYFYFQIASNIISGEGVTFHGYTPTNGFHPLWMIVVTALQALAQDRHLLPHFVMATVVVLAIATFFLMPLAARRLDLRYGYIGLAILVPYSLFTQIGSESALVLPLTALAAWAFARFDKRGRTIDFLILHLILDLAVLSRLDTVFVASLMGACSLFAAWRLRGFARGVLLCVVPGLIHVLLLGGYLYWNWIEMGHVMPISGALKGVGEEVGLFSPAKIADMGWAALALVVASAVLLLAKGSPRQRLVLLPLYGGVCLHAAYISCFTSGITIWAWYYGAWMVAGAFALAHLASGFIDAVNILFARVSSADRISKAASFGFACISVILPAAWLGAKMPDVVTNRDAGWARAYIAAFENNLPKNQGVFVFDYPGALAYLGGYRVLPADGLVNDYAYQEALQREGIAAYLQERRISYVMAPGPDISSADRSRYCGVLIHNATRVACADKIDGGAETAGITVYAALDGKSAGFIPLPRDHLAFTVPSLGFGVWRLDHSSTQRQSQP